MKEIISVILILATNLSLVDKIDKGDKKESKKSLDPKARVLLSWASETNATYDIHTTTNLVNWELKTNTTTDSISFNIDSPKCFFKVLAKQYRRFADAESITLVWEPSEEILVSSYKVYFGTNSLVYDKSFIATNNIFYFTNLVKGGQYFFNVTALSDYGMESDYTDEVCYPLTNLITIPVKDLKIKTH